MLKNRQIVKQLALQSNDMVQANLDLVHQHVNELKKQKLKLTFQAAAVATSVKKAEMNVRNPKKSFEEIMKQVQLLTETKSLHELVSFVTSMEQKNNLNFNRVNAVGYVSCHFAMSLLCRSYKLESMYVLVVDVGGDRRIPAKSSSGARANIPI